MLISSVLVPNRSESANILPVAVNPKTKSFSLGVYLEWERLDRLVSYPIHSVVITLLSQRVTRSRAEFAEE